MKFTAFLLQAALVFFVLSLIGLAREFFWGALVWTAVALVPVFILESVLTLTGAVRFFAKSPD